jgi:hypothetical protein
MIRARLIPHVIEKRIKSGGYINMGWDTPHPAPAPHLVMGEIYAGFPIPVQEIVPCP